MALTHEQINAKLLELEPCACFFDVVDRCYSKYAVASSDEWAIFGRGDTVEEAYADALLNKLKELVRERHPEAECASYSEYTPSFYRIEFFYILTNTFIAFRQRAMSELEAWLNTWEKINEI